MTQQQETFAGRYVACGNATAAYKYAYPSSVKWKPHNTRNAASLMLKRPEVAARVRELRAQVDKENVATLEETLGVMTRVLRCSVTDVMRPDGSVDVKKLRKCRQELEQITFEDTPNGGSRVRVKFRDPVGAADRLAKLQGWDKPQKVVLAGAVNLENREKTRELFRSMSPEERRQWLKQHQKPATP